MTQDRPQSSVRSRSVERLPADGRERKPANDPGASDLMSEHADPQAVPHSRLSVARGVMLGLVLSVVAWSAVAALWRWLR
jgi:hypothetical protein